MSAWGSVKLKVITTASLYFLLIAMAVRRYFLQQAASGFFFNIRLPELINVSAAGHYEYSYFEAFPLSPALLVAIEKITGLCIVNVIYLPLTTLFFVLLYAILINIAVENYPLSFFAAFPLFFAIAGNNTQYTEYFVGYVTYVLFVYAIYKYYLNQRRRNLAIVVIIYVLLKGFSPHVEFWAVSMVVILAAATIILHRTQIQRPQVAAISTLAILLLVMFFFTNPKFYSHLLSLRFVVDPLGHLADFYMNLTGEQSTAADDYQTGPFTPGLPRILNILYIIVISTAMAGVGLADLWRNRLSYEKWGKPKLLVIYAAVLGMVPDTLMMIAIGQVSQQIPFYLGGIFVVYGIMRLDSTQKRLVVQTFSVVLICIIVTSYLYLVLFVPMPYSGALNEGNSAAGQWVSTYDEVDSKTRYVSDLRAYGILRTNAALHGGDLNKTAYTHPTVDTYQYLNGESDNYNYDKIYIHEDMYHHPVKTSWDYYQPFTEEYKEKQTDINVIYDSGTVDIIE